MTTQRAYDDIQDMRSLYLRGKYKEVRQVAFRVERSLITYIEFMESVKSFHNACVLVFAEKDMEKSQRALDRFKAADTIIASSYQYLNQVRELREDAQSFIDLINKSINTHENSNRNTSKIPV